MAIKALIIKRKIELKQTKLEELRKKDETFKTREAELEQSIAEAETDEEQEAIDAEVEKFTAEKDAHEAEKAELETEITDLEEELREVESVKPPEDPENRGAKPPVPEREVRKDMATNLAEIRNLPKNRRAFDILSDAEKRMIVERDDTKELLKQVREAAGSKRGLVGADLEIPEVLLPILYENMFRYSKLMNRVNVVTINGKGRMTIAGTIPEAIWTEMCAAINELDIKFNQVVIDGYKVAGFIPACNSSLEDLSDIDLAGFLVEALSQSIGFAKDKAILYGKGSAGKMPLGIVTRLAQESEPSDYPASAPEWTDLHTTNIQQISTSLTGAEFWSALVIALGNTYTTYSRGDQFWAMNSKTYNLLKSKVITFAASGDVVANVFDVLPIVTGNIDILEFIPDGDIIGGYGDLYLWGQRSAIQIDQSEHVMFIQDNTVFRGKERADGLPVIAGGFVAVNINGNEVTTSIPFAADKANDSLLQSLAVGTETLSPTFNPATLTYNVTAAGTSGAIEAVPAQASAAVEISYGGKNVRNGRTVTYATGNNPLTVTVKNGNAKTVYTVNINKAGE